MLDTHGVLWYNVQHWARWEHNRRRTGETKVIVYEENPMPRSGASFDFGAADATKFYLEHYRNWKLLQFISTNTLATFAEKQQARKELTICDRKLAYWSKHPNFDTKRMQAGVVEIDKEWK